MALSNDLVSEFVKVTKDDVEIKQETTVYGTIVISDEKTFVQLDGSELLTPIASTASVSHGDRVTVMIKDHSATVTGNLTDNSVSTTTVQELDRVSLKVAEITAETGVFHYLSAESINADKGRITDLETNTLKATDITAENGDFHYLNAESVTADRAKITTLESTTIKASDITADTGQFHYLTTTNLDASYATINMANVNNAWIENGVIRDAAISDEKVISVSANKLTAGTIDAAKINVTNLNASNLTVGTINGARIGDESIDLDKLSEVVPTKEYVDRIVESAHTLIDSRNQTWTSTEVPTLNNYPANTWMTDDDVDAKSGVVGEAVSGSSTAGSRAATELAYEGHVGDILYVTNAASEADGFCYRFTKNSDGTYSWNLIRDGAINQALQQLIEAQGDISGLKTFETTTSKWIEDTDEKLETTYISETRLETELGTFIESDSFNTKVESAVENSDTLTNFTTTITNSMTTLSNTVNTVQQTADKNTAKIGSVTQKKYTDEDGVEHDTLTSRMSTIEETADSIDLRVQTVESDKSNKKTLISEINMSPEKITISADKLNLEGYTTFSSLEAEGETVINGANIATGTIDAKRLNVADIFANDITATGSIQFDNGEYSITSTGYTENDKSVSDVNISSKKGDITVTAFDDLNLIGGGTLNFTNYVGYMSFSSPGAYSFASSFTSDEPMGQLYARVSGTYTYYPYLSTYNVKDFIKAEGTSGIWHYRKWNSGLAEVWGSYPLTEGYECSTALYSSGWYYTDELIPPVFPITFKAFTDVTGSTHPHTYYSYKCSGDGKSAMLYPIAPATTTAPGKFRLLKPYSGSKLYGYIEIYAFGAY